MHAVLLLIIFALFIAASFIATRDNYLNLEYASFKDAIFVSIIICVPTMLELIVSMKENLQFNMEFILNSMNNPGNGTTNKKFDDHADLACSWITKILRQFNAKVMQMNCLQLLLFVLDVIVYTRSSDNIYIICSYYFLQYNVIALIIMYPIAYDFADIRSLGNFSYFTRNKFNVYRNNIPVQLSIIVGILASASMFQFSAEFNVYLPILLFGVHILVCVLILLASYTYISIGCKLKYFSAKNKKDSKLYTAVDFVLKHLSLANPSDKELHAVLVRYILYICIDVAFIIIAYVYRDEYNFVRLTNITYLFIAVKMTLMTSYYSRKQLQVLSLKVCTFTFYMIIIF